MILVFKCLVFGSPLYSTLVTSAVKFVESFPDREPLELLPGLRKEVRFACCLQPRRKFGSYRHHRR